MFEPIKQLLIGEEKPKQRIGFNNLSKVHWQNREIWISYLKQFAIYIDIRYIIT